MQNTTCTNVMRCGGEEEFPMENRVMPWKGVFFFAGIIFVLFAVLLVGILNKHQDMEKKYLEQQAGIVTMARQVATLRTELERVGTDGYVENEARSRYGYVRDGEIRFEFSDPDKLSYYTLEEWDIVVDAGLFNVY